MISICAGHGDVELHPVGGGIRIVEGGSARIVTRSGVPLAGHPMIFKGTHINLRTYFVIGDVVAASGKNDGISPEEGAIRGICNDGAEGLTRLQAARNSSTRFRDIGAGVFVKTVAGRKYGIVRIRNRTLGVVERPRHAKWIVRRRVVHAVLIG